MIPGAECEVSTDKRKLDLKWLYKHIPDCYTNRKIPLIEYQAALENSLTFGVYLRKNRNRSDKAFAEES